MGTSITITYASGQWLNLPLSNSAGEAKICALVVAGSREILETVAELQSAGFRLSDFTWETTLLTCLASHDRVVLSNSEGFDIGKLGWTSEAFPDQKKTFLQFIESALMYSEQNLGHVFNIERLLPNLGALRLMVNNMTEADIPANSAFEWLLPPPETVTACPEHEVFLHSRGCLLCHLEKGLN